MECDRYDCVACVSIGDVPLEVRSIVSDNVDIYTQRVFFSVTEQNFKVNFGAWLRIQYWNNQKVLILLFCMQVDERVSIETRSSELIDRRGKTIDAKVKAVLFGRNDFSKISIGVCDERYTLERVG